MFNWTTGSVTGPTPRAGKPITILIDGLNPLCYSYKGSAEPVRDTPDLSSFLVSVTETRTGSGSNAGVGAMEVGATKTGDDSTPNGRIIAEARRLSLELKGITSDLSADVDIAKDPCTRDIEAEDLITRWSSIERSIDRGQRVFDRAQFLLEGVKTTDSRQLGAIDEINKVLAGWSQSQPAWRPYFTAIAGAAARSVLYLRPANPGDTKAFLVTVTGTKLHPAEDEKPDTRSVSIPVTGTTRIFVSTGMLVTWMPSSSYRRVNRPYVTKDSAGAVTGYADSSYSTYAAQDLSSFDHFSPAVQLNAAFGWKYWPSPMTLSFGVAARTANKVTRPEPYFGLSVTAADRFVVSVGAHWTRVEELRIVAPGESAADVERRKVPSSVTDADAIGIRGKTRVFASFTVRP